MVDKVPDWLRAFREGVAPALSDAGLAAVRNGLAADDPALVQADTALPLGAPPGTPCVGGCLLVYALWKGDRVVGTTQEAVLKFTRLGMRIDLSLSLPLGVRSFLMWYDRTPRAEMRSLLLPEIEAEIARRAGPALVPQ